MLTQPDQAVGREELPSPAEETFNKMDNLIHWRLVRWARRRHPNKSPKWCANRYWQRINERNEFAATVKTAEGPFTKKLLKLADTEIVRHEKIKADYNPFDPSWEAYGEKLSPGGHPNCPTHGHPNCSTWPG